MAGWVAGIKSLKYLRRSQWSFGTSVLKNLGFQLHRTQDNSMVEAPEVMGDGCLDSTKTRIPGPECIFPGVKSWRINSSAFGGHNGYSENFLAAAALDDARMHVFLHIPQVASAPSATTFRRSVPCLHPPRFIPARFCHPPPKCLPDGCRRCTGYRIIARGYPPPSRACASRAVRMRPMCMRCGGQLFN